MRKQHLPRVERKQLQGEKHEGVSKAEEKQKDLPLIGRLKKETLCVCGGGGEFRTLCNTARYRKPKPFRTIPMCTLNIYQLEG